MIGRGDHIRGGRIRTGKVVLHDEGDLGLDPRLDKSITGNLTAIGKKHVLEQHAAVGNVDVQRILHGLRGQADLPAADGPASG